MADSLKIPERYIHLSCLTSNTQNAVQKCSACTKEIIPLSYNAACCVWTVDYSKKSNCRIESYQIPCKMPTERDCGVLSVISGHKGTGQPGLNTKIIKMFDIPPLPEQHRIVARVDALMALCDHLEARLKERGAMQGRFANAVVKSLGMTTETPDIVKTTGDDTSERKTLYVIWYRVK